MNKHGGTCSRWRSLSSAHDMVYDCQGMKLSLLLSFFLTLIGPSPFLLFDWSTSHTQKIPHTIGCLTDL